MKVIFTDADNNPTDAALEIYNAAHGEKINPQVLLVTLEKESNALTRNPVPDNEVLKKIAGWDPGNNVVPLTQKSAREQIRDMAAQFRRDYYDRAAQCTPTLLNWQIDTERMSGDTAGAERTPSGNTIPVTPENKAIVALYGYNGWVGVLLGGGRRADGTGRVGGNGTFCFLWNKWNFSNPPTTLIVSLQNPTLSCPGAKCVSLNASGGTPPYSWTTNKPTTGPSAFTLQVTGVHQQNARFRPPVNSGGYPGVKAYAIGGISKACGDTSNVCTGGQTTQSCSGSPFGYGFGCNDQYLQWWWGLGDVCVNGTPPGAFTVSMSAQICYDSQGASRVVRGTCNTNQSNCNQGTVANPILKSYTRICTGTGNELFTDRTDKRSETMKDNGCRPCSLEVQGSTVTVTDSSQPPLQVTVNVNSQ